MFSAKEQGQLLTLSGIGLRNEVMQRLGDIGQSLDLHFLHLKRLHGALIHLSHLVQLRGNLARKLHAMLDGRVWFKRLALYFFQQVRTAAKKFVM